MRKTATDVARGFSQVLDEIEATGRTGGRRPLWPSVEIGPARSGNGAMLRALLAEAPDDPTWVDELRELRGAGRPMGD